MKRTITKKELTDTQRNLNFRKTCDPIRYKMIELARLRAIIRSDAPFGPTYGEIQTIFKDEFDELHTVASKLDGYVYSWHNDPQRTDKDKDTIQQYEMN